MGPLAALVHRVVDTVTHQRQEASMSYPETADLERELAPAVVAEILAVRSWPYPRDVTGVADDALPSGCGQPS